MKRILTTATITLIFAALGVLRYTHFFATSAALAAGAEARSSAKTEKQNPYGKVPLSFERNDGQTDAQVKFLSRGAGYALFLTDTEAVLRFRGGACEPSEIKKASRKNCEAKPSVLRLRFEPAVPQPEISGSGELAGKSNYLNLDGTGESLTDVPNFERVNYAGIYEGIDLVFYGNQRQLEYDFNVQPNADPKQIKLNFDGAENLSIDADGNLVVKVSGKDAQFNAPVAYQTINGERRNVAANYLISQECGNTHEVSVSSVSNDAPLLRAGFCKQTVTFELGEYDETETLVIDPILQYSSYLGGNNDDYINAIAVNAAGEAYLAGETYSTNFPVAGAIQPTLNGESDGFLTKLNASGSGVVFSTYLGGAGRQRIGGIALDTANNISIAGTNDQSLLGDAYVGKLNAAGNGLVYPTVNFAGNDFEGASNIALDAAGNAYVVGTTYSTNFPTTAGVIQPNDGAGVGTFVARVNTNGAIAYATYLDGAGDDYGYDIGTDAAGNAYIVGQRVISNTSDGFILKLNPTGSALGYPTLYLGGTGADAAYTVDIDGGGNAYVGGQTFSTDFPTTAGVIQPASGGGSDAFLVKVNPSGNGTVWSTYLGGIGGEGLRSVRLDSAGKIYVGGFTSVTGDGNALVARLNSTATAIDYNAQFGGTNQESVTRMAIDPNDNIYLAGQTQSNDYLTTAGAFDRTFNGGVYDGFVMKINAPESSGSTTLNVSVSGNAVVNAEQLVAQIHTGDTVTINNISGTVNFNTQASPTCTGSGVVYNVNANGLLRSTFEEPSQQLCYDEPCNDPLTASNNGHAGLYVMRGAAKTFIGLGGTTFTATADQPLYLGINDCSGAGSERPNSGSFNARVTITPAASTVINVTVPGNSVPSAEKFVAQLHAGEMVTIDNIGGQVTFSSIENVNGCIYTVNANGLNRSLYDNNTVVCYNSSYSPNDPLRGANEGHAGLYMMRGTAKTFVGLNRKTFTVTADQPLYFGVNDADSAPNTGSFNARVTIVQPATTTLNVNVPGNAVKDAEKFVTQLNAGDQVTINNIGGQVNFDSIDDQNGCPYVINANGLDRGVFNDIINIYYCYNNEWTPNDPLQGASNGHAGLYMMRDTQKTFIGLNGATFTATGDQPLYLGINDVLLGSGPNGTGGAPNTGSFNATVTINRAASIEPTLSADTASVLEGNSGTTNAAFTVSLSPASTQTVTVRYQTANGTATAGTDYTATGGTLTFAPGETSKPVSVPVTGDTLDEPSEYFTLQLINPTNAQTVIPRGRANITDDDAVPTISISDVSIPEGNSGTTNAVFNVSLSSLSGNTVTVNYATANGSAIAPGDYTTTSGTLTFAPGTTSKTVSVPIIGDTLVEANETFNVNLSAASNATIADAQGIGTITNDDAGGSIQFSASAYSVNEAAANVAVTVTRTGGAASGASINYAATNGTATGGQDFAAVTGSLFFGANETSKTFNIAITNDTLDENNETVNLTLSAPGGGATLGSALSSVLTIIDDDTAGSVQFSAASASVNEVAGNVTLTVTRTGGSASGVTVNYATQSGTATAGQDFTAVNGTIAFGAAETSKTLVVPIINDTSIEGNEAFTVNLSSPSGGATLGTPASVTVTIVDNDSCSYSISPSSQSIPATSSTGAFSVIAQTGCAWTAASSAAWLTITGGASGSGNGSVNFSVAENTGAARVGTITAAGQTFTVSQSAAPNPTPTPTPTPTATPTPTVTPTPSPTATPTPTPTASPTPTANAFQFSAASYLVGEGDQSLVVNITRTGDTSGAASVSFATDDLAGSQNCNVITGVASSRCDYETRLATVKFAPGEASRTVSVFIIDDSYLEGPETFTVSLSNPSGAALGGPATATVSVTDDETVNGNNPIDTAGFFVRQHYLDFLNREPDSSGLNFWAGEIAQCGTDAPCLELKRINVSAAFYLSIEFQETGYLVERLYKAAYGNAIGTSTFGGLHQLPVPIVRLSEFLPDTQKLGEGVVVGQTGWAQVLENNKQAFAAEFVQRLRFTTDYPNGMTAAQFVDALNVNAGNPLSQSERDQLVAALSSGAKTRAQVLRAVAEDSDLVSAESNRAFVLMQFFGYLRRNPNDLQDTDYSGYDFWLTKLNQFNGNFVNAEMVKAFITSGEYRQRFGILGGRQGGY